MEIWYLDDDLKPVCVDNVSDLPDDIPKQRNRVGLDTINGVTISTVFLCTDHAILGQSEPILYETLLFPEGTNTDFDGCRYETRTQAEAGHNAFLKKVISGEITPPPHDG